MDDETRKKLVARLRRAEGQVAAVRRMIEEDGQVVDALLQIAAARGALGKAGLMLLGVHVESSVNTAMADGDPEHRADHLVEMMEVFARYSGIGAG